MLQSNRKGTLIIVQQPSSAQLRAPVSWIRLQGKHWAVCCVGGVGGVGRSLVKWRYINGFCRYTLTANSYNTPTLNTPTALIKMAGEQQTSTLNHTVIKSLTHTKTYAGNIFLLDLSTVNKILKKFTKLK